MISPIDKFITESNAIEGIFGNPTHAERDELMRFIDLDELTVIDVTKFVRVYQPDAKLRKTVGLNVRVGSYLPPEGGPRVLDNLKSILHSANLEEDSGPNSAYYIHHRYESLHPYTDGNGRSGRAIWLWQMGQRGFGLPFLQSFYYQALDAGHRG